MDIKVCTEIRDQSGLTEECLEILGQWMQQITGDPVKTMCTLVKKFEALRSEGMEMWWLLKSIRLSFVNRKCLITCLNGCCIYIR